MGSSTETVAFQVYEILKIDHEFLQFLAIFRNEITTIPTPSTSEGGEWGRLGWLRFCFGGP